MVLNIILNVLCIYNVESRKKMYLYLIAAWVKSFGTYRNTIVFYPVAQTHCIVLRDQVVTGIHLTYNI